MARLNRLSYVDRATGESIRRYVHPHPGSLVHVVGMVKSAWVVYEVDPSVGVLVRL